LDVLGKDAILCSFLKLVIFKNVSEAVGQEPFTVKEKI